MTKGKSLQASFAMIALGLFALILLGWAVWAFFRAYISPDWTRMIAIAGLVFLPVVGWACYNMGLTESKGKLKGIDAGIERVTKAAATAIDLRATGTRAIREASKPPGITLPQPPVFTYRQIGDGDGEVVEL